MESPSPAPATPQTNRDEIVLDVGKSTNDFIWRRHFFVTVLILVVTIGIYFGLFSLFIGPAASTQVSGGMIILFVLPLLIPGIPYYLVRRKMRRLFFTEFAASLGFTYEDRGDMGTVSGHLFELGHSDKLFNVLSGTCGGAPIRLYNYQFVTSSGKKQQTHHYIVGEVSSPGNLPHIIIEPHTALSFFSSLLVPSNMRRLTLEGDFSQHFDVYVPEGSEMETLQVLEPATMAELMDGYENFGFECSGTKAYVFREGKLAENRDKLNELLRLLERLYTKLIPNLQEVASPPDSMPSATT